MLIQSELYLIIIIATAKNVNKDFGIFQICGKFRRISQNHHIRYGHIGSNFVDNNKVSMNSRRVHLPEI